MECTTLTKCQATCKQRRVAMATVAPWFAALLLGSVSLLISKADEGGTGIKSRPIGIPNKVHLGATLSLDGCDEVLHSNMAGGCSIVIGKRLGKARIHNTKHAPPSIAGRGTTLFAAYYPEYRAACREITDWNEKIFDETPGSSSPNLDVEANEGIGLQCVNGVWSAVDEATCVSEDAITGDAGELPRELPHAHELAAISCCEDQRPISFGNLNSMGKRLQPIRKRGLADHDERFTDEYSPRMDSAIHQDKDEPAKLLECVGESVYCADSDFSDDRGRQFDPGKGYNKADGFGEGIGGVGIAASLRPNALPLDLSACGLRLALAAAFPIGLEAGAALCRLAGLYPARTCLLCLLPGFTFNNAIKANLPCHAEAGSSNTVTFNDEISGCGSDAASAIGHADPCSANTIAFNDEISICGRKTESASTWPGFTVDGASSRNFVMNHEDFTAVASLGTANNSGSGSGRISGSGSKKNDDIHVFTTSLTFAVRSNARLCPLTVVESSFNPQPKIGLKKAPINIRASMRRNYGRLGTLTFRLLSGSKCVKLLAIAARELQEAHPGVFGGSVLGWIICWLLKKQKPPKDLAEIKRNDF